MTKNENNLPIATKWTLDAVGDTNRAAVKNVFMIVCSDTGSKGSGFLM